MQKTNVAHFLLHTYVCNHDRNYQTAYFECSGLRMLRAAARVLKMATLTVKQLPCSVGGKGIVTAVQRELHTATPQRGDFCGLLW
jgi:hypothetical protein